jgi:hypothetical protein
MLRKIVLEDDSFMEEEIVDDYEVLREIRNASWPRDRELHAREPVAPNDLLVTYYVGTQRAALGTSAWRVDYKIPQSLAVSRKAGRRTRAAHSRVVDSRR